MKLTQAQSQVVQSKARWRVCAAGRRFGKTTLIMRELCRFASVPDKTVWAVFPSYRMAKQIMWTPLKHRLQDLRWLKSKDESDLRLDLINGSTIALRGADNPDSLRGNKLWFCALDETADIASETFYEVLRPALADERGHALFAGTPKGTGNWFYDLYTKYSHEPDWQTWQYTTLDGGNVDPEEIEQAKNQLDERTFKQEFLASFETWSGIVMYNWNRNLVQTYTGPRDNLHIGVDFNIDPMSAVVYVKTGTGLHAIDEIVIPGSNTDELADEIKSRYPNSRITCYPDPAGVQRKTSAGGRTDIQILQNHGFVCLYRNRHPAVRDRINAANSLMKATDGTTRFAVDPGCKKLMESFEKLVYKSGTVQIDKNSGWDHMVDAGTYIIDYLFPVTDSRPLPPAPSHWGVGTR